MKKFKFRNSKKEDSCCQVNVDSLKDTTLSTDGKGVRVLGTGCPKCKQLEANTVLALEELGMSDQVEKITDLAQIATYGVMSTPALWVDGKVLSFGKVLSKDEIISYIQKVR